MSAGKTMQPENSAEALLPSHKSSLTLLSILHIPRGTLLFQGGERKVFLIRRTYCTVEPGTLEAAMQFHN
jgi:hypothetical protein